MRNYSLLLAVLGVCACSGDVIDVGPGSAGSSNTGVSGANTGPTAVPAELACTDQTALPTWPAIDACAANSNLPVVGTWHGYVEQQSAPWDELTLVIRGANSDGGVCGTLTVGSGPTPTPATDPNLSYPDPAVTIEPGMEPSRISGFPLTLFKGSTDGTRLRFTVHKSEIMRSWCALQDSYRLDEAGCDCLPNWPWNHEGLNRSQSTLHDPLGTHEISVSLFRFNTCTFSICACNAQGCDAAQKTDVDFDLRFAGDTAEGTESTHTGLRTYFTRVQ